jgi:hypothetical protein
MRFMENVLSYNPLLSQYDYDEKRWQKKRDCTWAINRALRPFSHDYEGPVPSLFLYELPGPALLEQQEQVLVRDGILPLLEWFRKNPHPQDSWAQLLIAKKLLPLVPASWHHKVRPYELGIKSLAGEKSPKKLFFFGLDFPSFCSSSTLAETLSRLESFYDLSNEELEVCAYLPLREDPFRPCQERMGETLFTQLQRTFAQTQVMKESFLQEDLSEWTYVNLGEDLFCLSDNFFEHKLLAAGARPFLTKRPPCLQRGMLFSPFHSLSLTEEYSTKELEQLKLNEFSKGDLLLGLNEEAPEELELLGRDFYAYANRLSSMIE